MDRKHAAAQAYLGSLTGTLALAVAGCASTSVVPHHSPTPTPLASTSPAPTQTPTATPSPGPSSSPTATPSASPSSTASPTPTASPTASPMANPAITCATTQASSAPTTIPLPAPGTPYSFPVVGSCGATITFQSGSTTSGSVTFQSFLGLPPGAPTPLPTAPGGAQATALFFVSVHLTSGSSVTIPPGANGPDFRFSQATTAGCSAYYTILGTSTSWLGYGDAEAASGTVIDFPPSADANGTSLTGTQPYYLGVVCT